MHTYYTQIILVYLYQYTRMYNYIMIYGLQCITLCTRSPFNQHFYNLSSLKLPSARVVNTYKYLMYNIIQIVPHKLYIVLQQLPTDRRYSLYYVYDFSSWCIIIPVVYRIFIIYACYNNNITSLLDKTTGVTRCVQEQSTDELSRVQWQCTSASYSL